MLIVFGVVLPDIEPEQIEKRSFLGIGFGKGGVPIDILPIFQLGTLMPDFDLLVVDEFLRLNCVEEDTISYTRDVFIGTLDKLGRLYGKSPGLLLSSDFMGGTEYKSRFEDIISRISGTVLEDMARATVPQSKRHLRSALDYPAHEVACVEHMTAQGYEQKIGPSSEQGYDSVIRMLGIPIEFAYILDAYATGTSTTDKVVHYVPNSRGSKHGQRIYFGDSSDAAFSKVSGTDEAVRYLCRIASVSGALLGGRCLCEDEMQSLRGKRLRKTARSLVHENILRPYREVM